MKLETITPAIAREWLSKNTHNRPLRARVIAKYAASMKSNQWEVNGETIKFSEDGRLLDGQHRLTACVQANKTFQSWVIRGLPSQVFDTIDTGKNREAKDILALEGAPNAQILAPALRFLYIQNEIGSLAEGYSKFSGLITNRDILEVHEKHPGMAKSVSYIVGLKGLTNYMSFSVAGFLHYQFAQFDEFMADDFFMKISKGVGLEETNPCLILRNKLLNLHRSTDSGRLETIALTIKAWNAYRKKRPVKVLRWQEGEDFPVAA